MCPSIEGVRVFTKAILDSKPWDRDPLVVRKPWDESAYALRDHGGRGARLCFAIMWDNGVVRPFPPLKRAMEMTKAALEAAGHKGEIVTSLLALILMSKWYPVSDWKPHKHYEIYKNAVRA